MSPIEALILGLVQGLTEFFPVSSSAHLALAEHFLGFKDLHTLVFFDLVCHLGTLLSIGTIFKKEIVSALKNRTQFLAIALGTLPLFPLALFIKPLKGLFDRLDLLGYFFLVTALLIWLGVKVGDRVVNPSRQKRWDPLLVGCFQALAVVPGISRSGSTISGGRLLGWPAEKAVSFSFLLAIPAILGAFVLEARSLLKAPPEHIDYLPLFVGFVVSYLTGLFALKVVIRYATKKNLLPFAWYCLILGLASLIYF